MNNQVIGVTRVSDTKANGVTRVDGQLAIELPELYNNPLFTV
jgi:hypothetical protein